MTNHAESITITTGAGNFEFVVDNPRIVVTPDGQVFLEGESRMSPLGNEDRPTLRQFRLPAISQAVPAPAAARPGVRHFVEEQSAVDALLAAAAEAGESLEVFIDYTDKRDQRSGRWCCVVTLDDNEAWITQVDDGEYRRFRRAGINGVGV